ncbi:MBL fold metallo-hydrolase [Croceicoccus estronivorus]|uniref:MBL fold metallo-hydrolase n=1 Tax=Croceicoccus estronivorus TaxID=1172626 RepID=UPI00083492E9|nr:MBL fold metallo-hydrolase [Croceicoccus estronivorus]OCC24524.1 MBL fold metallo-hydrolase [Croceicoccus estronivorus]
MKLLMLGSGTSSGVPRVGNDWGACDPTDARNRRTRASIIIEGQDGARLLIDTSTDLRQQLLDNAIDRIDAVFWTHDHADHCHGIDDLRALRYGRNGPLPGFAADETVRRLRQRFGYIFAGQYGYPTIVSIDTLDRLKMFAGIRIDTCQMPHGPAESTAFRFDQDGKSIGYATDFSEICDDLVDTFADLDLLVVDCLRRDPHPTHANVSMALELGQRCKARTVVLTHLDKSLDYRVLSNEVPDNVLVGHDGLVIDV